ncbi:hypothetical protein Hypma_011882 [Hypsizygus marmoreus]|uniref:Uncharacterized protein n=1 Tax=Hypsizygus marmoreus TaxID=39966 RepID=A0A369JIY4_HYPMA|nr:hypothetical protein Hypma_011882 [Hypsizygus marmoreus]
MSVIKVYGYVVNEDAVLQHGLAKGYGTAGNTYERHDTMMESFVEIADRARIFGHARFVGVLVKGKPRKCIALACNDPDDPLPMPPRRMIDSLKEVLETDREPRWYIYD